MKNERKKHFWQGMNKLSICAYLSLSVVFGLLVYSYSVLIFTMAGWIPLGGIADKASKFSLFVIVVVVTISIIYLFRSALLQSRDIEKKQERGEEIRF